MRTLKNRSITLHGAVCGPIWWPARAMCGKDVRAELSRDTFAEPNNVTFRDMIDSVMMREDGDFQHARFTADTYIEIEHTTFLTNDSGLVTRKMSRVRFVELASLPSVSDYVDADTYSGDFGQEDDE